MRLWWHGFENFPTQASSSTHWPSAVHFCSAVQLVSRPVQDELTHIKENVWCVGMTKACR